MCPGLTWDVCHLLVVVSQMVTRAKLLVCEANTNAARHCCTAQCCLLVCEVKLQRLLLLPTGLGLVQVQYMCCKLLTGNSNSIPGSSNLMSCLLLLPLVDSAGSPVCPINCWQEALTAQQL